MSVPAFQAVIEGFWIKNYKGLRQIAFGSSFQQSVVSDFEQDLSPYELTPLTTFIGDSGTGKRSILDAFAFVADVLNFGLDEAIARRGGFDAVYHRGSDGAISIGIVYRACSEPKPLTYAIGISRRGTSSPKGFIETETILYRGMQHGKASQPILFFQNGNKQVRHVMPWATATTDEIEKVRRTDDKTLALSVLGNFEDLPDVPQLKRQLERFHLGVFTPDNGLGLSPPNFKIDKGKRLSDEFKYFLDKHRQGLPEILNVIAQRMPNIEKIEFQQTESGRMVLNFRLPGINEPFAACQISEGALRLFSHLLLFEDPMPAPLIGIEEPGAYMDEVQIRTFCSFVRDHVYEMGGSQFLISTHQPNLVDFMDPTEVWMLIRDPDGTVKTYRALDELAFQGVDLNTVGPYWYTDYIYRNRQELH